MTGEIAPRGTLGGLGSPMSFVELSAHLRSTPCRRIVPLVGPLAAVGEHRAGLGGKSIRTVRVWRQSGDGAAYCQ